MLSSSLSSRSIEPVISCKGFLLWQCRCDPILLAVGGGTLCNVCSSIRMSSRKRTNSELLAGLPPLQCHSSQPASLPASLPPLLQPSLDCESRRSHNGNMGDEGAGVGAGASSANGGAEVHGGVGADTRESMPNKRHQRARRQLFDPQGPAPQPETLS